MSGLIAMSKLGDEPAFPIVTDGDPNVTCVRSGLTKREWFAGQALAGMLGHPDAKTSDASTNLSLGGRSTW